MITDRRLPNVDLATFLTMATVYRLRSFSAAADELGVAQPTVSYAINRLRQEIDDPLFVRQGGKTTPTERCRGLMPVVDRILADAETLTEPVIFNPVEARGTVRIHCSALSLRVLLPLVLRRLRTEAPHIETQIIAGYQPVSDILLEGRPDIALVIAGVGLDLSGIKVHDRVISETAVCIMDPSNPLAGRDLSVEEFARARHLIATPWPNWKPPYVRAAETAGVTLNVVTTVTDPLVAAYFIEGTDMVTGLPSLVAQTYEDKFAVSRLPFESEDNLAMYWTEASSRSPLLSWVRSVILEEAQTLTPGYPV